MSLRRIAGTIISEKTIEGGGFPVRRPFPTRDISFWDPFLLLDEMGPVEYAPGKAVGAPDHPHRGFETVTYLLSGEMEHRDSWGHAGKLTPGGVQWMTAGSGLIHSELPSKDFQSKGGRMHGFQIWINLPGVKKFMNPNYQELDGRAMPTVEKDGVWAKVIAGELWGTSAAISTQTPILLFHLKLSKNSKAEIPVPKGFNLIAYPFVGNGSATDEEVELHIQEGETIFYDQEGDTIWLKAPTDSDWEVLLLGGIPINEPVARYGPFVMNTAEEIQNAFTDFSAGKMGKIS
ncbi:pirin [Leptospira perolatii]|uniref:Pirin n=1 Tax=Leptospira perolatii TaxID=2023191 RepID=A0A2M9ZIL6_9LEPT|nr:pirin family protein [Leptospira perolatii]PJZ68473.1 pirin [Leptospira perolatii]PJZ71899.1 pirin [Leptospira perolatii]